MVSRKLLSQFGSVEVTPSRNLHFGKQASSFIRALIAKEAVAHADEAASWDTFHERFENQGINHQEAYSLDGACSSVAKEYSG
jgi:hypothetical protein